MKVNILCLTGAALGVVSLLFPWWQGVEYGLGIAIDTNYMLVQDVLLESTDYGSMFLVACTLFVVGTLLAFWSPLGGLVQVLGALGFFALFSSEIGVRRGEDTIAFGAYIGVTSMVIVVVSLLVPMGIGYSVKRKAHKASLSSADKFVTVSNYGENAKIRLNALALVGALVAFTCIALPWSTLSAITPTTENVVEQRPLLEYLSGNLASPSSYVFIIGSAMAVITTLGAIVQMLGFVWFWLMFSGSMGSFPGRGGTMEEAFGIGFYLSVLAMLMVAVSIILPAGLGYFRRRKNVWSRLTVWGEAGPRAY